MQSSSLLMPSQAITGSNSNTPASMNANAPTFVPSSTPSTSNNRSNNNNAAANPSQRRKPRRGRGRKKAPPATSTTNDVTQSKEEQSSPPNTASKQQQSDSAGDKKPPPQANRKGAAASKKATQNTEANASNQQSNPNKKNSKKKRRNNNNKNKKWSFQWRKFIPQGSVDPITLDSLDTLPYPPFALDATPPYQLIPEWPLSQQQQQGHAANKEQDPEERQRQIIQQQWGNIMPSTNNNKKTDADTNSPPSNASTKKTSSHVNLFDGRALAYYMVSQLQFIDPLNRRDVTRDELRLLDQYLIRHGFTHIKVVEAYDAKGISISTAGAASRTTEGRVQLFQQEAQQLLNALFGGSSLSSPPPQQPDSSSLQRQYQNHERTATITGNQRFNADDDMLDTAAVYGDEALMIIDDNENPDLRGANLSSQDFSNQRMAASANSARAQPTWYGSRYRSATELSTTEDNFPALSTPSRAAVAAAAATSTASSGGNGKQSNMSKSLKKISASVKKVSQEELQRQWEAREEARRRAAMMSHLTFQQSANHTNGLPQEVVTAGAASLQQQQQQQLVQPSPAQLERNQAFAQALGVTTTTNKNLKMTAGWSRPTTATHATALYPQTLLQEAKEQMALVMKLERKWMAFLSNAKEPSLPLNYMDRSARKVTHEYAAFWKMATESFDPEPKRYVHCRKLLDTSAPFPLLSDVARHWRPGQETIPTQTAGQITTEERPLERPKLELLQRSLPLELPPFQPTPATNTATFDITEQMRQQELKRQEKAQKEQEKNYRRMKMLEAAFASDDEDDGSSSEWSEKEELYPEDLNHEDSQ